MFLIITYGILCAAVMLALVVVAYGMQVLIAMVGHGQWGNTAQTALAVGLCLLTQTE